MRTTAFLGLGSNMGDRSANLSNARKAIGNQTGEIILESSVYLSEPWGEPDQEWFYNQVIAISTDLSPRDLLEVLLSTETALGRERSLRNAPRTIDLDILLYGEKILDEPGLLIPHPRMMVRNFVLIPLMEIAGERIIPGTGRTVEECYWANRDELAVCLLDDLS